MPTIQWDSIQTSRVLPEGFYNLKIAKAELVNNTFNGALQINLELRVVQPESLANKVHFEFLQLGQVGKVISEDKGTPEWRELMAIEDLDFEDPRVQQASKELKTFKKMLEAAGVSFPASSDLEDMVAQAKGQVFTAQIVVALHEFGKRAGQEKNVIENILSYGSQEPRLERKAQGKSKVAKPQSGPKLSGPVRPKVQPQVVNYANPVDFFDADDDDVPF